MAKSYRTANIRVTSENETKQDGTVLYTLADIEKILIDWAVSAGITYWFIEHEADDEVSLTHFHIVIKFKTPMPFEPIKNKFPYGYIDSAHHLKASVQYLIHLNDPSKVQYSWDDVRTNCLDMTPYKIQSVSQQEVTIQTIIDSIKAGEIKEYNQFDKIPNEIWAKYRSRIENSLLFERERIYMDKNRSINVIFMSGPTGVGKTTFAKSYCDTMRKHCCVSSSSNDPLQDYKGEEVLIMDDLRDTAFAFSDLLKFLDNHTKSTGKSRYHNKAFIGDTIIITSSKPITDWYFNEEPSDRRQLYRRVRCWYKFTIERIYAFEYSDKTHRYEPAGSSINPVTMDMRKQAKLALKLFDDMGMEFVPADRKALEDAANMSDEDLSKFMDLPPVPEATEEEKKIAEEEKKCLPAIDWEKVNAHRVG